MKLSLGFLITEHYYSKQYGVSVGGQLIFGPRASLRTPFGLGPFICFILCRVLAASFGEVRKLDHIARGSQRPSSDQLNRLCSLWTISIAYTHTQKTPNLPAWWKCWENRGGEKCKLWNLIDCLSFIWPFTPPLCNMVRLSAFVINYMHVFAWI